MRFYIYTKADGALPRKLVHKGNQDLTPHRGCSVVLATRAPGVNEIRTILGEVWDTVNHLTELYVAPDHDDLFEEISHDD